MSGDGAGAGDGEGEAMGHPGLSDTSAANTQGMAGPTAGPAGSSSGSPFPGTESETISLTIAKDPPEKSFELSNPFNAVDPDVFSRTPGIAPPAAPSHAPGLMGALSDLGYTGPTSDNGQGAEDGSVGLLSAPPIIPRVADALPQAASWDPSMQQVSNYQYGAGQWNGNDFVPAPIIQETVMGLLSPQPRPQSGQWMGNQFLLPPIVRRA